MKTWNERLAYALRRRDKNPADLARATGAKPPSVKEWLDGITKNIGAENAVKACGYLDINIEWLMFGKGVSGLDKQEPILSTNSSDAPNTLTEEQALLLALVDKIKGEAREPWLKLGDLLTRLPEDRRNQDAGHSPDRRRRHFGVPPNATRLRPIQQDQSTKKRESDDDGR